MIQSFGALLAVATISLGLGNKVEFRLFGILPLLVGASVVVIGRML